MVCCPVYYIYVDAVGNFNDIGFGTGIVINPTGTAGCYRPNILPSGVVGIDPAGQQDPITCPCCQVDSEFSSFKGVCMTISNPHVETTPVPCVNCVCPDPVPFECPDCESKGQPIHFAYDFHSKQCNNCQILEDHNAPGHIAGFLPIQYLDPFLGIFKLKNKNYM